MKYLILVKLATRGISHQSKFTERVVTRRSYAAVRSCVMGGDRERLDPRSDPAVRFAVLGIVDEELDQSAPELAEELQDRADHPDDFGVPVIAPIPDGWVIDWRDVARWLLEDLEREDPPLVERVSTPEPDLRFGQRPWPASPSSSSSSSSSSPSSSSSSG